MKQITIDGDKCTLEETCPMCNGEVTSQREIDLTVAIQILKDAHKAQSKPLYHVALTLGENGLHQSDYELDKDNYKEVYLTSNKTVDEIRKAYTQSCELTGISMHHISSRHEYINDKIYYRGMWEKLKNLGCPDSLLYHELNYRRFTDLWVWFVKLSLPSLEMAVFDVDSINDYDSKWQKKFGADLYYKTGVKPPVGYL